MPHTFLYNKFNFAKSCFQYRVHSIRCIKYLSSSMIQQQKFCMQHLLQVDSEKFIYEVFLQLKITVVKIKARHDLLFC